MSFYDVARTIPGQQFIAFTPRKGRVNETEKAILAENALEGILEARSKLYYIAVLQPNGEWEEYVEIPQIQALAAKIASLVPDDEKAQKLNAKIQDIPITYLDWKSVPNEIALKFFDTEDSQSVAHVDRRGEELAKLKPKYEARKSALQRGLQGEEVERAIANAYAFGYRGDEIDRIFKIDALLKEPDTLMTLNPDIWPPISTENYFLKLVKELEEAPEKVPSLLLEAIFKNFLPRTAWDLLFLIKEPKEGTPQQSLWQKAIREVADTLIEPRASKI